MNGKLQGQKLIIQENIGDFGLETKSKKRKMKTDKDWNYYGKKTHIMEYSLYLNMII